MDDFQTAVVEGQEWAEMRRHPEVGARILDHANLRDISGWVLAHQEPARGPSSIRSW